MVITIKVTISRSIIFIIVFYNNITTNIAVMILNIQLWKHWTDYTEWNCPYTEWHWMTWLLRWRTSTYFSPHFYLFTSTQFATYIKKWLWPTMFTMTIYKICLFGWISEYKSLFWHFTEWHLFLWTLLPHDEYTEFSTIEEQESPFASSHKGSSGVLLMMSHIVVWLSLFIMI